MTSGRQGCILTYMTTNTDIITCDSCETRESETYIIGRHLCEVCLEALREEDADIARELIIKHYGL